MCVCVCVCVCSKLGSESYVSTYVVLITFERSCCHGGKCLYTYKQDTHGHILFFFNVFMDIACEMYVHDE